MPAKDRSEGLHMTINAQTIAYRHGDTELTGQFAWDAERGDQRPGILVVHGGAGLYSHAQGRANRLAELGFVVFACAMYGRGVAGNRERIMASIAELRDDTAKLCQRARAGIDVLVSHLPGVPRRSGPTRPHDAGQCIRPRNEPSRR
ncbi:MAG: hypothetical protein AUG46_01000 [Acidobacteria bacterium 13_1_20CM_3_58_11]|nr:MAG: hypothetical protein AUG46_01000 [Acidobacteria bacterium 13_1_20CM_3_58_11]